MNYDPFDTIPGAEELALIIELAVGRLRDLGVVVTITTDPAQPPAQGNYGQCFSYRLASEIYRPMMAREAEENSK